jgi:dynein heavy chain 1, cytosolic
MIERKLLAEVRKDLQDVAKIYEGVLKQTDHLRGLMNHLTKVLLSVFFERTF